MRYSVLLTTLFTMTLPAQAQTSLEMGSITYRAAAAAPAQAVPATPIWLVILAAAALLWIGVRFHKLYQPNIFSALGLPVVTGCLAYSAFSIGTIEAQTPSYSCPQANVPGTVSITNVSAGEVKLTYDPSAAIALCSQYIGTNYVGPGTLTMQSLLAFQITNDTGVTLELDAATFTQGTISTSIQNFPSGTNTVNYTNMQVTPTESQSGCGSSLAVGQSCTVTMTADTVGDLTVT